MKISLIFISTLLVSSMVLPFLLFIYNGVKNTSNTKTLIKSILKNNGLNCSQNEIWRKSFMGISNDEKILTYINTKLTEPIVNNIALSEIKHCNIIKNYIKDKDKVMRLNNLDLEFLYKGSNKIPLILNFYNVDDDLSEDFELQRIEKWHQLILSAIQKQSVLKLAS